MHGQWLYSDTEQEYYSEVRENNGNVWSVTPDEGCGQIVRKEEEGGRGLMIVESCAGEEENSLVFYVANNNNINSIIIIINNNNNSNNNKKRKYQPHSPRNKHPHFSVTTE